MSISRAKCLITSASYHQLRDSTDRLEERYSQEHVAIVHRSDISAGLHALLLAGGCGFNPD